MTIIYVMTSGQYSDYHIDAIFSDKGLAEEYVRRAKKYKWSYINDIEEWELDKPIPENGLEVQMDRDGAVLKTDVYFNSPAGFRGFGGINDRIIFWNVQTEDAERAIKVVNEKRTAILVLGIWGDRLKIKELIK